MSGSLSVDGLVSGLDTTSLITSLMQVEAAPQTALKSKVVDATSDIAAYQNINSRFASLQTAATLLTNSRTWTSPTASSSSPSVAATAGDGAATGALSFDVTALATAHSVATAEFGDISEVADRMPPQITIAKDGQSVTITAGAATPESLVAAINRATFTNGATLGVQAVAIQTGPGKYRLQLTSKDTGAAHQFAATGLGSMITVKSGADATIDLGGGFEVRSPTNTFTDVLPGTSFTVSARETGVTVSAAVNQGGLADKVQSFIDAANAALTEISLQTNYNVAAKSGGPLTGDATVKQLQQSVLDKVSGAVGSLGSPASAGIQLNRDGKLTFDRAAFLALQTSDPTKAQALVQGVATRLGDLSGRATDKISGSLTTAVNGQNSLIKDLNARIDDWDVRLALRKETLQRQFTAMETALSSLKDQSSWLAGQINSLGS